LRAPLDLPEVELHPRLLRHRHGWASPYDDARPLYCQAAGCGQRIKAWYSCRAVLGEGENSDVVWAMGIEDPVKLREYQQAVKIRSLLFRKFGWGKRGRKIIRPV
jgi:hypothetical protein